jgi:hypothetical protein
VRGGSRRRRRGCNDEEAQTDAERQDLRRAASPLRSTMPSRRTAGRRRRCFGSTQATASKGAAFTYDDAETLNSSSVSHPCFLRLPQRHCCRPTRALNVFDIVMLKRHRGWSPWGEPS